MFMTFTMIVLSFQADRSRDYEDPDLGKQAGQDLHCSHFQLYLFCCPRCSQEVVQVFGFSELSRFRHFIYAPCINCVHQLHYYVFHMTCHMFVYILLSTKTPHSLSLIFQR